MCFDRTAKTTTHGAHVFVKLNELFNASDCSNAVAAISGNVINIMVIMRHCFSRNIYVRCMVYSLIPYMVAHMHMSTKLFCFVHLFQDFYVCDWLYLYLTPYMQRQWMHFVCVIVRTLAIYFFACRKLLCTALFLLYLKYVENPAGLLVFHEGARRGVETAIWIVDALVSFIIKSDIFYYVVLMYVSELVILHVFVIR